MMKFKTPAIAAAIVAALAGTTGYCVVQKGPTPAPAPITLYPPPVRLDPQVITPHPLPPLDGSSRNASD